MTGLGCSTLLLNSKVPEQMTADCWRWCPRWNRLASSTSCFGSSACLQSLSSVLCRTAYGLKSPQGRLGSTHAEGAGHPDKPHTDGLINVTRQHYHRIWYCVFNVKNGRAASLVYHTESNRKIKQKRTKNKQMSKSKTKFRIIPIIIRKTKPGQTGLKATIAADASPGTPLRLCEQH